MVTEVQTQIYILSISFGSVCFILLTAVLFLICSVYRLNKLLEERSKENNDFRGREGVGVMVMKNTAPSNYPPNQYPNPNYVDELEVRGFSSYKGSPSLLEGRGGGGGGGGGGLGGGEGGGGYQVPTSTNPQSLRMPAPSTPLRGPGNPSYDNNGFNY